MNSVDDIRPWDRQPGESSKAYAAYQAYQSLGEDRSLQAVSGVLSKSVPLMKRWAAQWGWVERARAWDSMPTRKTEEAYGDMAARIAKQHEDLATALMAKLRRNVELLPEGADPSMRFSTALTAARGSHSYATDLSKPADPMRDEISKKIGDLLTKLAGDE